MTARPELASIGDFVARSRKAQGLPKRVKDAATLKAIAGALARTTRAKAAR